MDPGLELQLVWWDDDLDELDCRASNGNFSGLGRFYAARDAPEALAQVLDGFPRAMQDRREIELGSLDPNNDQGGLRLVLDMARSAGPARISVMLRNGHGEQNQTVQLLLKVEPAAIDEFVRQLRSMERKEGSSARLRAV
jgi:hypothetical protein